MKLDYYPKTGLFGLSVPRAQADLVTSLQRDHGLDFSTSASTADKAVMLPPNIYSASAYAEYASPAAMNELQPLLSAIEASWKKQGSRQYYSATGEHQLFGYQEAGVEYALDRLNEGHGALIGDEPGLGKTMQAIVLANEIGARRVLVICPANVRLQWARQIRIWSHMAPGYIVYPVTKSADGIHPKAEWTVISYDLARTKTMLRTLRSNGYDLLILDEGHYLKTPDSIRTQAVFGEEGITAHIDNTIALTGTPLPNRPRECYTLARNLCWPSIDYMTEKDFRERFNPKKVVERRNLEGRVVGRATREANGRAPELQARLRANFMVRRLKRDVLDQLPDIRYEVVHVEETGDIRKAIEAEKMLDIDPENLEGLNAEILGHISVVRHMMGLAMAPQVADYADYVLKSGEEKLVVFAWHKQVLSILEERLAKWGVVRVDGTTTPARRQLLVDQFVANKKPQVFIGNLQSVGVGVDGLQRVCSRALFAESSWTWADNEQGIGRLERIGQHAGIFIEFLVAPGSFSERVLGTSLEKLKNIHQVLDERRAQ